MSLVSFLFFFSGALGLVYEVLWHRQFSLLLGSGAPATAVVLAAYFTGLGLGSFIFGKMGKHFPRPLVVYAILELVIAIGACAVAPILSLYASAYPGLVSRFGARPEVFLLVKALIALSAIAVPTIAMGGTLPILAELMDSKKEHLGFHVGWLYLVNSAGAALGAMAFPLILLPVLGVTKTTYACAASNAVIAFLAFCNARKSPILAAPKFSRAKSPGIGSRQSLLLWLAFISGAGTFALQVIWNRAFAQLHENSIFSFALIAGVFILAIATGAEVARLLIKAGRNARKMIGLAWIAGGSLTIISPFLFVGLSNNLDYLPSSHLSFIWNERLLLLLLVVIFVPISLLASGMPLLLEEAGRNSKVSASELTGSLWGANIVGSIAGALIAGFILPAVLGMWKTAALVGVLFLISAIWVSFPKGSKRALAIGLAVLLGCFALAQRLPRTRLAGDQGEKLLALEEGPYGVVAVTERAGSRRLKLNNHYVLGGTSSTGDERMQAHLPLILHPQPRTAAFLGYGTGITAGGAIFHPGIQSIALELVPEVASLASHFFAEANLSFGSGEKTKLVVEDGRNFLRGSGETFDVIIGDLVVPWRPGEADLYTLQHFAAAKKSLNEKGIFCVWIPMFQVGEVEFKIILRTFLTEFGKAFAWRGDFSPMQPAIGLLAFKDTGQMPDPNAVNARLAQMTADPLNPQLRYSSAFFIHLIGLIEQGDLDPAEQRINSEDHPWLELYRFPARHQPETGQTFVGRKLQRWEDQVRERSRQPLRQILSNEAAAGWEAGALIAEYALLLNEEKPTDAIQNHILEVLGPEIYEAIFGKAP